MHRRPVTVAKSVRVQINTLNGQRDQWGRIIDSQNGKVLHTGQLSYIRRVARRKFNLIVN